MVKAKVQLNARGPCAFHGRGRRLSKGESIIVTDPVDIRYFQMQGEFSVTVLEGSMPKVPRVESVETFDDDDDVDLESEDPNGPVEPSYTRNDLAKQNKPQLVELGNSFGLELTMDVSKSAMVDAIIDAQQSQE
jgi:hypothetical protein